MSLSILRIEVLLKGELKRDTLVNAGYIYRCYGADLVDRITDFSQDYADFIDGWLEAGAMFTSKEDIRRTFIIRGYHTNSLYKLFIRLQKTRSLMKNHSKNC